MACFLFREWTHLRGPRWLNNIIIMQMASHSPCCLNHYITFHRKTILNRRLEQSFTLSSNWLIIEYEERWCFASVLSFRKCKSKYSLTPSDGGSHCFCVKWTYFSNNALSDEEPGTQRMTLWVFSDSQWLTIFRAKQTLTPSISCCFASSVHILVHFPWWAISIFNSHGCNGFPLWGVLNV